MNAEQFRAFIKEILPLLGYRWRRFDRRNTRRKIRRRMEYLGIHEPVTYAVLLAEDPKERSIFESLLPITITRFFRNAWLWSGLGKLLSDAGSGLLGNGQTLRLWSAGCAGGEEAFTAAMLLDDATRSDSLSSPWTVLGTDIDIPSLERSRNAKYSWGSVRETPERIRQRWFTEENGIWILGGKMRELVDMRRHDFIKEDPPGLFHIVLLRNSVLTYNMEEIQKAVLLKVHGCLMEPGLLVIGRTERMPEGTGFEEVEQCIYRKV